MTMTAAAAARYWPERDPVGEQVVVATQRMPGTREQPRWMTVVGVVDDVRYRGLTDPRLDVYLPAAQSTARVQHLLVRTTSDPELLFPAIRTLARELRGRERHDERCGGTGKRAVAFWHAS